MLSIDTYFKIDEQFIRYENFKNKIQDESYIEGAITLVKNEAYLLNKGMWDYIDQLWSYFLQGFIESKKNNNSSFYFPDQPIQIELTKIYNGYHIKNHENQATLVLSSEEVKNQLLPHILDFFHKLINLIPNSQSNYQHIFEDIEWLEKHA